MKQTLRNFNDNRYSAEFVIGDFERARVEKMLQMVPENKKVLDLACNEGTITNLIQNKGNDVIGVDMSINALSIAHEKRLELICASANELPFKHNTFDVVVAGEIIEHIFDTNGFLNEINRVLINGGQLIITTPNIASLTSRIRLMLGLQPSCCEVELEGKAGHIRAFSKGSLINLLEKHGLFVSKKRSDRIFIPILNQILGRINLNDKLGDVFPGLGTILIFEAKNKK